MREGPADFVKMTFAVLFIANAKRHEARSAFGDCACFFILTQFTCPFRLVAFNLNAPVRESLGKRRIIGCNGSV